MKEKSTTRFCMHLTVSEKEKIKRLAQREGLTAKDAILRLVNRALGESIYPEGSFLHGLDDIIGSAEGPGDLSFNPKYMEGFGEDICRR